MRRFNGVLFDDIANEILERYRANPDRRTYITSRAPVNHLLKTFGGELIRSISCDDFFLRHVPRAQTEMPWRNLNNDRKLFIQVLFIAYRRGLIRLPPSGIKKPSPEESVGKEIPQHSIDLLLSNCKNPTLKFQIEIALLTGMRLREILRLRWDWISPESGIISLPAKITKTKRGRRVPCCGYLIQKFKDWKEAPISKFLANREHVFPSQRTPWKPTNNNATAWKNLLKTSSLAYRFHDLRHTNATRRVRAGTAEGTIVRVLGMSEKVLRNIYVHLSEGDLIKSAEDVSDIITVNKLRQAN